MRRKMAVGATAAFRSTVFDDILRHCAALFLVSSSFEWHHFVRRSALFTNSFVDTAPLRRQSKTSSLNFLFFYHEFPRGGAKSYAKSTMQSKCAMLFFMSPRGTVLSHKQKSTGQSKCAMLLRRVDMRRVCAPWCCRSGSAPGLHPAGPLLR